MDKISWEQLKKLRPKHIIKQFLMGNLVYKDTGKLVKCQVKGCEEKVSWKAITKDGKGIVLCFGHGEEF